MKSFKSMFMIALVSALVSACGGAGAPSSNSVSKSATPAVANVAPGGIWQGTDPNNNLQMQVVITEDGNFTVTESNGIVYIGTLTMTGDSFDGSFQGYTTQASTPFWDGSKHGTGSVSGTVSAQSALKIVIDLTTDFSQSSNDTIVLHFNEQYNLVSSLAIVSGTYTDSVGDVYTIDGSGSLFSQSATTGCVINGQVSVVDATHSVYQVTSTVANCTGSNVGQDGTSMSGLATLDSSASPAQLSIIYAGTDEQAKIAQILSLSKM